MEKIGVWVLLFFCLILGAVIRFNFLFQESLWPDEALYLFIARNLSSDWTSLTDISGNIFYHNPPLLMYLLSLLPHSDAAFFTVASRAVVILMGIGTIAITFFIGKKVYHPVVGVLAAGFLAVCPLSNWSSIRILTDIPVVFFIYLAVCMLVYDKKALFILFGLCAVLTKYTAFPVLFLPLFLRLKPRSRAFVYAGIFAMLVLFILVRDLFPLPADWLRSFYYYFQFPDIFQMFFEMEFFLGYFLIAFAFIGILFTIRDKNFSALFDWVVLFGLFRFFLPWMVFRISRYTLPLYPGLLILAAFGCYQTLRLTTRKWPVYAKWITLFFILAVSATLFFQSWKSLDIMKRTAETFVGYGQAGEFLKNQPGPHSVFTPSARQMKYYLPSFTIHDIDPGISPEQLISQLEQKKVRYLAVDLWSPHLPAWCRSYNYIQNGYVLIYRGQGVYIFTLDKWVQK